MNTVCFQYNVLGHGEAQYYYKHCFCHPFCRSRKIWLYRLLRWSLVTLPPSLRLLVLCKNWIHHPTTHETSSLNQCIYKPWIHHPTTHEISSLYNQCNNLSLICPFVASPICFWCMIMVIYYWFGLLKRLLILTLFFLW